MEDTLEAMDFVDQLVKYIAAEQGINYFSFFPGVTAADIQTKPHFDIEVGTAVSHLITAIAGEEWDCYDELINENHVPEDKFFAKLALQAVPTYFPEGYTPVHFIAYCAMIIAVSLCFLDKIYKEGGHIERVLTLASGAVSTVLVGFMMNSEFQKQGGWKKLIEVCTEFNVAHAKCYLEKLKKQVQISIKNVEKT